MTATKAALPSLPATPHDARSRMPTSSRLSRPAAVACMSLALALGAPAPALGRGGGDEDVRVTGTCGKRAESELRLRAEDGAIRVEFEVDANRPRESWRVVLVHERRVVWRGRARTRSGSGSFRVRRSVPDFAGVDQVTARASGPGGNTCQAAAVLTAS